MRVSASNERVFSGSAGGQVGREAPLLVIRHGRENSQKCPVAARGLDR